MSSTPSARITGTQRNSIKARLGPRLSAAYRLTWASPHLKGRAIVTRLLAAAAALASSIPLAFAQKAVPGDRVYELHSEAQGSCPSLNWHMVASPAGILTGMVAWDNRKVVAMVTGTIVPLVQVERYGKPLGGNPQSRTFEGIATEVGGQHRVVNFSGTIEANGWLNANVQGPGVVCQNIKVPLSAPPPG